MAGTNVDQLPKVSTQPLTPAQEHLKKAESSASTRKVVLAVAITALAVVALAAIAAILTMTGVLPAALVAIPFTISSMAIASATIAAVAAGIVACALTLWNTSAEKLLEKELANNKAQYDALTAQRKELKKNIESLEEAVTSIKDEAAEAAKKAADDAAEAAKNAKATNPEEVKLPKTGTDNN